MAPRLELQTKLEELTANVYFQPPSNFNMDYPCIVYRRAGSEVQHAGNRRYRSSKRYEVTVITRDPDSSLPDAVEDLPLCSFERHFTADNLNHDVFNLHF